jgi:signal transduction histidine kinase
MASLALERCRLFQRERSTLEALEEAQRIARVGSWCWVPGTETIEWSTELYRIHGQDPATFHPTIAALQDVCHPQDRDSWAAGIQRAAASRTSFEMEYRIFLPGGHVRTLHGLGKVTTGSGGALEMIGTVQDVTEQRRLEAVRNEFIANAAHELRTPLTTLTGMAMLLAARRHQLSDATLGEAFAALGRQGERARVLINNMLDLSQLDAQRIPITMEQVPLATVVRRAQEAVALPVGKEVEILVPEPLSALADPARLEQVITNLLSNAYRYGGRHVRVEARRTGGRVILSVTDDGPGVPDDLVSSMFEPFTRGQAVTGTVGSGLGLAISRRLVDAFAGRMSYECQSPHGARFLVDLQEAA